MLARLGHGQAQTDGDQHVVQGPPLGYVVVHVARGHQRRAGAAGKMSEPIELRLVVRPLVQFGQQITAVAEDRAIILNRPQLRRTDL